MSLFTPPPEPSATRAKIEALYRADEETVLRGLMAEAGFDADVKARIDARARSLVTRIRENRRRFGGLDVFLAEYGLTSEEGVTLMCLAESLLRIPDAATADKLIRDKIGGADWDRHLGNSQSLLVNASTWALMLTGRVVRLEDASGAELADFLGRLVARSGEPVIRQAMVHAMRIMGRQFVIGRDMDEALAHAKDGARYRYSFDMLGEAAMTAPDAERYFERYAAAIARLADEAAGKGLEDAPGISVKLSALHPRFEFLQRGRVMAELVPRLLDLARQAKSAGIGLTVDAEEANRLEITLDVFAAVAGDAALKDWDGLGLAVQAYQRRARAVVDWLADLADGTGRRLMVRLVKGAYWDSEIKRAQVGGYAGYSVFTRKEATDVSYLACARALFEAGAARIYPQFATHNAHSLAAILELAGGRPDFEFQRLHGMGEPLYDQIAGIEADQYPCRVYAPVGGHEDLLAYLVRRLLENGANSSFVHRIADDAAPIDDIVADPVERLAAHESPANPTIPLPRDLYGEARRNSTGLDLTDPRTLRHLAAAMPMRLPEPPKDASAGDIDAALTAATAAQEAWDERGGTARAEVLERAADLMEAAMPELMSLAVLEAGKTLDDAVAEVREAVDFCRYYAERARADFAAPMELHGPTGERNTIELRGRGVFACISPWNFPLAIFTGQVAAALAAGNAVLAKPAEQTPRMAARGVAILHEAGVPADVLHLVPGDRAVGAALVKDSRIAGVAFTGSVETGHLINRALAARDGPIVPLIAETGGQNAMIVDSSALPEQVIGDAVTSAFRSAGQRCSALRVLCLQEDIADRTTEMLAGRMAELVVGDPAKPETDVGPVIDTDALEMLEAHAARMDKEARLIARTPIPPNCPLGTYFAPRAYEILDLSVLKGEVFGPILHVLRYRAEELEALLDKINGLGFGLTLGIHSRIDATAEHIHRKLRVGNAYVNRNMIGAVVGVQPFGGEGLSGTGPKAGGPRYLHRFAVERTLSVDTTAAGGNATLLNLAERGRGGV